MKANKPKSLLLSAQNNPSSHRKTIPVCRKPRRHQGFGIHCEILCIIKKIPPPSSHTPAPAYWGGGVGGVRAALPLRSDSRCLLQNLDCVRAEPGSPADTDDTKAGIPQNTTAPGFRRSRLSDCFSENWDPSVRKSTSSCLLLPAAKGQTVALLEWE